MTLDIRSESMASAQQQISEEREQALISVQTLIKKLARRVADQRPESAVDTAIEGVLGLLAAGHRVRTAVIEDWGWDTHDKQEQTLSRKLAALSTSLVRFHKRAKEAGVFDRLAILVVSEMGRSVHVNDRLGTEHGHAGLVLAMGRVRPGVAGSWKRLSTHADFVTPSVNIHDVFHEATELLDNKCSGRVWAMHDEKSRGYDKANESAGKRIPTGGVL
ncbi:MAG: DUF1501 domain-containing protein [Phycisphaerales bacterium]